jgi:pyruvate/2-oxoglutarate dehydrogenase complex dihydrolipoamide dehydrogenase (E3) component
MYDVIVIGGGPAGTTAALRARELGATVALVERGRMGGTCTNDGCAPTRVLAKAARLRRDSEQLADYGLTAPLPEVDLAQLMGRVRATIETLHEKKQLLENLDQAGVTLYVDVGAARFVDPHTIQLADERRLSARQFIICVGGHARALTFPGSELTLTHHDVWQLREVPESVLIVGAAATGCQLATIFDALGSRVTLVDVAPHILSGEDRDLAAAVAQGFHDRGIEVITGCGGVAQVTQTSAGLLVDVPLGETVRPIACAAVILAVGWVGNLSELGLDAAGVATERGYIVTDAGMRTSTPHIFAAGDINGRMMLVQSAAHEARTAAENALLGDGRTFQHQIVPHGGFTDPEYGSVGLTERQAREQEPSIVAVASFADLDRAVIDGRTEGFCKLIVSRESRLILGAHVVGEQALEIVHVAATCMAGAMTIERVAELEIAYPTYTMIIGLAARRITRELGLTPLADEWRLLRRVTRTSAEWETARYRKLE